MCGAGSNTYGGCGDINRNIMLPAVHFPNNAAYVNAKLYSQAIADLFKPMTTCAPPPPPPPRPPAPPPALAPVPRPSPALALEHLRRQPKYPP